VESNVSDSAPASSDAGTDAGERMDAGPSADAAAAIDAGAPMDAHVAMDGGRADGAVDDAAAARDAAFPDGHVEWDAGTDAGFVSLDAGFDSGMDAGFDSGLDAGFDAGPMDAGVDAGTFVIPSPPYTRISETGAYADAVAGTISPWALEFTPAHRLWTDGASKWRWIILPPGTSIDSSDPDHWLLPVGTRVFKEFSLPSGRLETRLTQRVASTGSASDWWMGAFIWNAARTEATFSEFGQDDVLGTNHDVPSQRTCADCHGGEPGRVLGFSTVQLSGASPLSLGDLRTMGLLSTAVADSPVPGTATERAALGYLHANCGHCHNPLGEAWRDTDMVLRVQVGEGSVTATDLFRSTVGVRTDRYRDVDFRIVAGSPDDSCVSQRMGLRDSSRWRNDQMPPLGTEVVDATGLAAVRSWIGSL